MLADGCKFVPAVNTAHQKPVTRRVGAQLTWILSTSSLPPLSHSWTDTNNSMCQNYTSLI